MLGIENTKEAIAFGVSLGIAIDKAKSDGKIDLEDIPHFIEPLLKLAPAIVDAGEIPKELADLDENEAEELRQFIADEFNISDDDLEAVINQGLTVFVESFRMYTLIRKL